MNIVITGGSRGIGKAIAEKFNKAGNTLLLCSRNINLLELAASELQQKMPLPSKFLPPIYPKRKKC